jgi:hypothetical protein
VFNRRLSRLEVLVLVTALAIAGYLKPQPPEHVTMTNTPGMHGPNIAAGSAVISGKLNIVAHRVPVTRERAEIPIVRLEHIPRGGSLSTT